MPKFSSHFNLLFYVVFAVFYVVQLSLLFNVSLKFVKLVQLINENGMVMAIAVLQDATMTVRLSRGPGPARPVQSHSVHRSDVRDVT